MNTTDLQLAAERGSQIRILRSELRIPRTAFALLVGIAPDSLGAKEAGRVRFRDSEIVTIKGKVAEHLAKAARALAELKC